MAVRTAVALLLLAAAALKGYNVAFGSAQPSLWNVSQALLEWLLGIWLLSGIRPAWSWLVTLIVFLAFIPVAFTRAIAGDASCGCFGAVQLNPWITIAIDLCVVASLILIKRTRHTTSTPTPISASIMTVGILSAVAGGWIMVANQPSTLNAQESLQPTSTRLTIEPSTWPGQPLSLLPFIDIEPALSQDTWTLLIYRHDCAHCRDVILEMLAEPDTNDAIHFALIEVPPYGPLEEADAAQAFGWKRGKLSNTHQWLFQTPLQVHMTDGQVINAQ